MPVLIDQGDAIPFFSLPMLNNEGQLVQNSLVPDVPSLSDLYENIKGTAPSGVEWDAIAAMIELDQTMQHVFLGPPDMDPEAAETFREGLAAAMATVAFEEEAEQQLSYVPGFVPHTRQTEILGATSNVSPEVLEYIKSNIAKNSGY